jgi:16S rRNA processing protein RimM
VALEVRTDSPHERLVPGTRFAADAGPVAALTLLAVRPETKGWFARFAELPDRTAAEAARGTRLLVDADSRPVRDDHAQEPDAPEPDAWYPHQLRGCSVFLPDGTAAGEVAGVIHGPAQDLLEIREVAGGMALVPFVRALVPLVDVEARRVVVDPPAGLLAVRPLGDEA